MAKSKNGGLNQAIRVYKTTGSRDLARSMMLHEMGITGETALKLMHRFDRLDVAISVHIQNEDERSPVEAECELYKMIEEGAKA